MSHSSHTTAACSGRRDRGGILPIVLVATVVFTLIVGAVATLVTTGLRYGNVVESRADRLAAADGGLRYGIERLRNMEDLCSTAAGDAGGYTTIFPPKINGADTTVTCRRVGRDLADIQGWGAVITGEAVPAGQDIFKVQGAGMSGVEIKRFRGPVYIADPTRLDFNARLIIEDGDLYYTKSSCDTPAVIPEMGAGLLEFNPSFLRGPECNTRDWDQLFKPPTANVPTAQALSAAAGYNDTSFPGCRIFYPGKYTGSIPLATDNYFVSGDYYFENIDFTLKNKAAIFGFPSGSGDDQKVAVSSCLQDAIDYDMTTSLPSGKRGGATIWAGGSTKIFLDTGGELEIFRRQQNEVYLSFYALDLNGAGFIPSSNSYTVASSIDWILETKSGNNNDAAVHGLFWAPTSKISLGNVTNAAIGQLIGGLAIGQVDAQASASATEFSIGVEGTPLETHFLLESTAIKDGQSTTIRAVVQFRPDSRQMAINSWRVDT
jgi:hypothetical protein